VVPIAIAEISDGEEPTTMADELRMGLQELLPKADMGIIRVRQRLIRAAKALRDQGLTPPGAREPELYQVRGAAVLLPAEVSWIDASADHRKVLPGVNQAGV
jgi:phthalate 4,5-dioxygenase